MEVATLSAQEILENHLQGVLDADIEKVISDYSEESILVTPKTTYKGVSEIRGFFNDLFKNNKGLNIDVQKKETFQNLAYITWKAGSDNFNYPFGTDSFFTKNGRILFQTSTYLVENK